jgi:hypothetical protein
MKVSSTTLKVRDAGVMAGIDKYIASPIMLGGTTYTPAGLKAVFQSQIAALEGNDALRSSLSDAVAKAKAIGKEVDNIYSLLRSTLIGQYGKNAHALLNDFGMTMPKTPGPKTVEAKALAVAKRAATRKARHTMGSVQKKAVTGNVVAVTVTPVVAGPAATEPATATPSSS